MDGMSSEANEENDNIQKPVRRRHSSILKPPRSPLQDLKCGNETVQESNVPRPRKSSRRVSFADTIKVFQTESHMKTERNSENSETEVRKNVLTLQNKNLDDNYCAITGMNTLLCAPIQTQKQQKEFSVIDYNHERKHANDQTVIFSDENQMDLTASHTVMISKDLSDCTQSKNFTKIDTTSFLEDLKRHTENSRIKNELESSTISISQNNFSENINSDFIKRLKIGKYSISLDKENSEIPIYSRDSNSASSTHQMYASLNGDENSSNRTRIFREQDDGMNLTRCHTASIQSWTPPCRKDNLGFKADTTVYGSECMELTANYTIQVLPSEKNLPERETETHNVMMSVTRVDETKTPQKKTVPKGKLNTASQDSSSDPENKIPITTSHNMESETHTVTQTFNQGASTLAETSKSVCASPTIQGYKTVFYSSSNDAMELTKCLSSMKEEDLLKPDSNYFKVSTSSDAGPVIEKTIYSEEDNMDITKSHTVVIDNEIFKQDQENIKNEITATPIFKKETMLQNHVTMSEDEKTNVNYIKSLQVSKEKLQQSLTNTLSVSLADRRIELLAGEDMDLTKSHTSKLSLIIPTTFDLASKSVTKSYSDSKSPPDEWKKMTKSLTQPFQETSIISKNILTDIQRKEKHPVLKISSCLNQKSPLSVDYNQDITTNHHIPSSGTVLDIQVPVGHTVQGQNSELVEPQRKNFNDPTPDCSHEKTIISSGEEQTMDLTKSHTIVIGFGPSEGQEQNKTDLEHSSSQVTRVNRQIDVSIPAERTRVGTTNEEDILKDRSVQKPEFLKEKQNVKICGRKSAGGLKLDKTILFSEGNENDMDITRSYTVKINHRSLLDKHDSHLVPMAGTCKTILYACGQDEMEITRSYTTALECKNISPDEITPNHLDKTMTSLEGHEELEMTKSHTVFIDYQVEEKGVLPDTLDFELSKKECLQKPKGISTPAEEINHPSAKGSHLTVVEERFNSGPRKDTNDDTETSKLATWKNVKNVQQPGFLNELSDKAQRRKSLRLKNNKTTTFPENDNNRDTAERSVLERSNEISLEDGEDLSFVPLAGTSKPVLSVHRPEDMEVSKSQIASEYKTDPADEISTKSTDKTVKFVDNLGELDVTKSHTVFIDCQAKEKVLHEYAKLGMARTKHLNGLEGDTCVQKASDPIGSSNVSCFSIVKPSLSNLNRKAEEVLDFQTVHILPPVEQLLEAGNQAHSNMSTVQATGMSNLGSSDGRDEDSKNLHGADTTTVSLKAAVKDKRRRCSLGIFLPKLPNKRNCSITGVDDQEQIPADETDLNQLETQPVSSKDSVITSVAARLNLSPSQYINEENLPICPGEILSSDSISLDIEEKSLIDTYCKEILPSENKIETCSAKKRAWVQEDDNVTNEKKIRTHDSIQDQEIFDHHTEGDINKNVNSLLMKSLSRTPSSCSSDQDSIKADGISLDISTQRNSQMESQFLSDSICEESLREKLKNGQITIKEFFILLQVHILIQKPRQSNLPDKFTINTSPTPEDLMLRQYVYGPKIQIYREDCELLRQKIEELKVSALNQDKLLTDVNRNLWGKMKDYSDEELKTYGIYLNKIKSRYTKMTKVFTHQGKVALYSKLVHSAENEKKKLQIKINEMDNILKKINNCLTEVEIETRNLENEEKDNPMEAWDSEMKDAEKELEQLRTEKEELQRKFLEVETQKTQTLAQIEFIKEQTNKTEELLDHLSFSEWDVNEWSDDQAIFTFVYDTIELTLVFGEPVVGLPFLGKAQRKINELNFQSLLDEDKAPPSSILVHKLIFQYIEEQESWKKKCTTQHQVPQMLQELSLVVNHCRLLGEEIEFLKRWGPNYSLMDINVNNNELKLLFSSSAAFAKFEIAFSLSAHYPLVPLQFTIQNHLGNIGHDEIAAVISKVPLEDNYLKNVVKQIYQDLLKD